MKLVIDKSVAFINGVFEPYAGVRYMDGPDIAHNDILDADALIIRTGVKCNSALLDGTSVKIIATATIGTDHIDLDYCLEHGIFVRNASGCNAGGVMDYVFSALYGVAARKRINLSGMTFGVVGAGNTGSRVADMARALGFRVLVCDPPKAEAVGQNGFCDMDYLLEQSDIVSLHLPLLDRTRKMADKDFFDRMKPGAIFINAARGELMDDDALIAAMPKLGPVVIDCWNNEPDINKQLLNLVDIATPRIAGFSYQGKQNGTASAVRAVARYFGISELYEFFPATTVAELEAVKLDVRGKTQGQIASLFQYNYPIFTDDFMFRIDPDGFDRMRSGYKYRREFYIDEI